MKNPTLLTLLKQGCTITFPCGYRLTGIPDLKYIQCATEFGQDGLWTLSREGLISALKDVKEYAKNQKP